MSTKLKCDSGKILIGDIILQGINEKYYSRKHELTANETRYYNELFTDIVLLIAEKENKD